MHGSITYVIGASNWSQSNKKIYLLCEVVWVQTSSCKDLGSTLRVTNIGKLALTSFIENKVDKSWRIIQSHVNVVSRPKLLLFDVQRSMSLCESITSIVAKPDVITLID